MSSELQETDATSTTNDSTQIVPENDLGRHWLGSVMMLVAALAFVLIVGEKTVGLPFEMPRSFYAFPVLWFAGAFIMLMAGVFIVSQASPNTKEAWQPSQSGQRFDSIHLYTRPGCHLCDVANDILAKYREYLPKAEEVNIESNPELLEKYALDIPVVACDGRVRFRGHVDEILLRRLIEATPPQNDATT
ncbi:glutaredoxin family protein [Thalassoroseus pseudoceratinae]|uniref:glutaredoxin family protein n=1 Tax=Thalassoroseus pseudoceratinae TaxID=2713176 RepID=UPI00197D9323|nr:glutaredoxin family protein [Thalassoroseus pseudoceratinae]